MAAEEFPSLAVRTQRLAAWAFALALFLSVGWMAMSPHDPLGPVSLLTRQNAIMMWLQTALLAVVCSVVATVLAGRQLSEAGLFATALGLAAVALRGDTAQYFLINCAADGPTCQRWLAVRFAGEAVIWFTALAVAIPAAAGVIHWCGWRAPARSAPSDTPLAVESTPLQVPHGSRGTILQNETVRHVAVVTGVMLVTTALLSSGSSRRAVLHGQTCFVVFAAAFLATWAGCRFAPPRGTLASFAALPFAAVLGYLWAAIMAGRFAVPPNLPASCFLRILPIHFIAVGAAGTIIAHWWMHGESAMSSTDQAAQSSPSTPSTTTRADRPESR